MDSSKHTTGKWYVTGNSDVNGDHLHIGSPDSMMVMASMNARHMQTKANAEFIVRACNSHELLIEALKDCARHPRKAQRENIVAKALAAIERTA